MKRDHCHDINYLEEVFRYTESFHKKVIIKT